jgi:predicted amidophosphoribosyltransferase
MGTRRRVRRPKHVQATTVWPPETWPKCPRCDKPVSVHEDKCPACGAEMPLPF